MASFGGLANNTGGVSVAGDQLFLYGLLMGLGFGIGLTIAINRVIDHAQHTTRAWPTWLRQLDPLHNRREDEVMAINKVLGLDKAKRGRVSSSARQQASTKCACGCGKDLKYAGTGRRPKYYNLNHKEYARGNRVSPD